LLGTELSRRLSELGLHGEQYFFNNSLLIHLPDNVYIYIEGEYPSVHVRAVKWFQSPRELGWRLPYPLLPVLDMFREPYRSILELVDEYDIVSGGMLSGEYGVPNVPRTVLSVGTYFSPSLEIGEWSNTDNIELKCSIGRLPVALYLNLENVERGTIFKVIDITSSIERYYTPGTYVLPRLDLAILLSQRKFTRTDADVFMEEGIFRRVYPPLKPCLNFLREVIKDYQYVPPRQLIELFGVERYLTGAGVEVLPDIVKIVRSLYSAGIDRLLEALRHRRMITLHERGTMTEDYRTRNIDVRVIFPTSRLVEVPEQYIEVIDDIVKLLRSVPNAMLHLPEIELIESRLVVPVYEVRRGGNYYYIILPTLGLAEEEHGLVPVIAYRCNRDISDIVDLLPLFALDTMYVPLLGVHYLRPVGDRIIIEE